MKFLTDNTEQVLLGSILIENNSYDDAAQIITANDFTLDSHQRIFTRISHMLADGRVVDLVTLGAELRSSSELDAIGGATYLASFLDGLPRKLAVKPYAEIIRERSLIRSLGRTAERLSAATQDVTARSEDLIVTLEEELLNLRGGSSQGETSIVGELVPLLDRIDAEHKRKTALLGLSYGLEEADLITRGLQDGEITILAAQSGVGKSVLMTQAIIANCRAGIPVLCFSLEMSRQQLLRRILAAVSGVPFPCVRDPKFASEADMEALRYAANKIADWPLHVVDDSSITIEQLASAARIAKRKHGVKLICVDYLQIVSSQGRDERLRVAGVSRGLTRLAKDEGLPVLALSQLSRGDRSATNRRPSMRDLRESSQIENDAHCILLLHRDWDEEKGRLASETELICAKQRSGETGVFPIKLNRASLLFESAQQHQDQAQRRSA